MLHLRKEKDFWRIWIPASNVALSEFVISTQVEPCLWSKALVEAWADFVYSHIYTKATNEQQVLQYYFANLQ